MITHWLWCFISKNLEIAKIQPPPPSTLYIVLVFPVGQTGCEPCCPSQSILGPWFVGMDSRMRYCHGSTVSRDTNGSKEVQPMTSHLLWEGSYSCKISSSSSLWRKGSYRGRFCTGYNLCVCWVHAGLISPVNKKGFRKQDQLGFKLNIK